MARSERKVPSASIKFGAEEWQEEVERYKPSSSARVQAQKARKEIDAGAAKLDWKRCRVESEDGSGLPGCQKLYVPLGKQGASDAPYGFVFQLVQNEDKSLAWYMIAFGERHPSNPQTRSVYERAHKRLHGRYPAPPEQG